MPSNTAFTQILTIFFTIFAISTQVEAVAADAGDVIAGLIGGCKWKWYTEKEQNVECWHGHCCSSVTHKIFNFLSFCLKHCVAVVFSVFVVGALIVLCAFLGWWSRRGEAPQSTDNV